MKGYVYMSDAERAIVGNALREREARLLVAIAGIESRDGLAIVANAELRALRSVIAKLENPNV